MLCIAPTKDFRRNLLNIGDSSNLLYFPDISGIRQSDGRTNLPRKYWHSHCNGRAYNNRLFEVGCRSSRFHISHNADQRSLVDKRYKYNLK